jgi:FtsP/CotA-like multicopper oxidase with cupredoxin domain
MGSVVAPSPRLYVCGVSGGACIVAFTLGLLMQAARAEDSSPKLIEPYVCSPVPVNPVKKVPPEFKDICKVTPLGGGRNEVKVFLTAKKTPIDVGGFSVETEHYNGAYLSPVIEAMPGDTVAAHLENSLKPRATNDLQTMAHGAAGENPTNLHYFHGGIVTPNNARPPIDAGQGNGDNIYVRLKNGTDAAGKPNNFDYNVPIPGEKEGKGELDARVLEGKGWISHPDGLNWYHSHMHGISSDQVMGGLAGLLSVGEDKANVRAKCDKESPKKKCADDTEDLKKRSMVRYALLQDISLKDISALPEDAAQAGKDKTAQWVPRERNYFVKECPVWRDSKWNSDPMLRKGFCQRKKLDGTGDEDKDSAWLFTLNGQRFPTIIVEANQNLLLRIGNLSANVAYWLELGLCKSELCNETTGKTLPLTVLSLDGVVPAKPVDPEHAKIPVDAFAVNDLLLMPASRAEIYVRNDNQDPPHSDKQVYILRTKGLDVGSDVWPEIQLARVVLEPTQAVSSIALALNVPIGQIRVKLAGLPQKEEITPPDGCVRDLGEGEHRRVTFIEGKDLTPAGETRWNIGTEIMRPKVPNVVGDERKDFEPVKSETIGTYGPSNPPSNPYGRLTGIGFEEYVKDTSIDWLKPHVCIRLDHKGSHQQLWVLHNETSGLHNFHIHQMKFRLATKTELEKKYHIEPPKMSHTCPDEGPCSHPDYKFYEEDPKTAESKTEWHDTIPVPADQDVFLIMSFDAKEQIGRFVFHCHILKHEDNGLMAPIEVWDPHGPRANDR